MLVTTILLVCIKNQRPLLRSQKVRIVEIKLKVQLPARFNDKLRRYRKVQQELATTCNILPTSITYNQHQITRSIARYVYHQIATSIARYIYHQIATSIARYIYHQIARSIARYNYRQIATSIARYIYYNYHQIATGVAKCIYYNSHQIATSVARYSYQKNQLLVNNRYVYKLLWRNYPQTSAFSKNAGKFFLKKTPILPIFPILSNDRYSGVTLYV